MVAKGDLEILSPIHKRRILDKTNIALAFANSFHSYTCQADI